MALNKKNRLKKNSSFRDIFRNGKAVKGSFLFIKYRLSQESLSRWGLVVSSKILKKAVDRNKIKRVLSEIINSSLSKIKKPHDIIVIVGNNIITAGKEKLRDDLEAVLKRAKII